jgi:hypothetical protein
VVLQLLGLDGGGPQPWKGDDRFDVLVADSPMEMEAILRLKHGEGFSDMMLPFACRISKPSNGPSG